MKSTLTIHLILVPLASIFAACGSSNPRNSVEAAAAPQVVEPTPELDPALLEMARELQEREQTVPVPTLRRKDLAESRHRNPLPNVEAVTYADATGLWREGFLAGDTIERHFSRSSERVFVSDDGHAEDTWVFVRNPVAPLQGMGVSAVVAEQVVVDLSWADVLDAGFGPTWNELALLGVDPADLQRLEPTGKTETAFGLDFDVLAEPGLEIAWNDEVKLPLRIVRIKQGQRLEGKLTELSLEADTELLKTPAELHPDWPRMDIADWREEHHETHGADEEHDH